VSIAARLDDKQFNGHRLRGIPHPLDDFPVRVLRIGRRYLVPIPSILALLGVE